MATSMASEQQIVEALHLVPADRWGEVLTFLHSLHPAGSTEPEEEPPSAPWATFFTPIWSACGPTERT